MLSTNDKVEKAIKLLGDKAKTIWVHERDVTEALFRLITEYRLAHRSAMRLEEKMHDRIKTHERIVLYGETPETGMARLILRYESGHEYEWNFDTGAWGPVEEKP